jgi:DNA-binding NtrC family response regulator
MRGVPIAEVQRDCSSGPSAIVLRSALTVLIVSTDATASALVGALIETLGYKVKFARAAGTADESLRRTHPRIYMIDCETTDLCADDVVARAIMRGVSVVLFGPTLLLGRMRELAGRHDIEIVEMPPSPRPLGDVLAKAARKSE